MSRKYKLAIPDLISNSYFPAAAAVELGFFKKEGLDVDIELIFPVDKCYASLRDGEIDFVAGSAHSALSTFPNWKGVKLLCAQAQGMYWFLVMRSDRDPKRGDLDILKGKKIGAAPWVNMGLQRLLINAGYDLERDNITLGPVPGAVIQPGVTVNFGLFAAKALEAGQIDGFWANGMGTEVAVTRGAGKVVLDIRRGDGPKGCFNYTMASIAASDKLIAEEPEVAAAVVRAIVATQKALKADVSLATQAARKLFPETETGLIAQIIERDLPYYDASISPEFVKGMNQFCREVGILEGEPAYEDVVATSVSKFWTA